jgi:adenosylmethionine-8-amino-7-oxononanoate aminotransferase
MTLAATLATDEIFGAFLSDDPEAALMHGPTYMANPLACAAANASLDLFEREPRLRQVEAIEAQLQKELAVCEGMDGVADVRVKGAIGVVQLEKARMDKAWLKQRFLEEGVWLRPLEDVIYIMPPFVISPGELSRLTGAVAKVLKALGSRD